MKSGLRVFRMFKIAGLVLLASSMILSVEGCKKKKKSGGQAPEVAEEPKKVEEPSQDPVYDQEVREGNSVVWRSADGAFEMRATPYQVLVGQTVAFASKCSGTMRWVFGDGKEQTGANVNYAFAVPQTYKVTGVCSGPTQYQGTLTIIAAARSQGGAVGQNTVSYQGGSGYGCPQNDPGCIPSGGYNPYVPGTPGYYPR